MQPGRHFAFLLAAAVFSPRGQAALLPPEFVQQPQSVCSYTGATVRITGAATGTEPIQYQWLFNGSELAHATGASLSLPNLGNAQRGFYTLRAENLAGATVSDTVFVIPYSQAAGASGGRVNFSNAGGGGNPICTNYWTGRRLSGDEWLAQLFAGFPGQDPNTLQPVGLPAPFLSGLAAGFFAGGVREIPGIWGGALAQLQVGVWSIRSGDTFNEARNSWQTTSMGLSSSWVQATTPESSPPLPPYNLTGLTPFFIGTLTDYPALTRYPHDQAAAEGQVIQFESETVAYRWNTSSFVTNDVALQWYKNGIALPGANLPRLTIGPLSVADAGNYCVTYAAYPFAPNVTQKSPLARLVVQFRPRVNLSRPNSDQLRLDASGRPGTILSVQSSIDCATWTTIGWQSNTSGRVEFLIFPPSGGSNQFFRAVANIAPMP